MTTRYTVVISIGVAVRAIGRERQAGKRKGAEGMHWQDIARLDPYLAGSIAARSWEWWHDPGATEQAKECGLVEGEWAYEQFMKGWEEELKDLGIEELQRAYQEQQALLKKAEQKGDPEVW